MRKMSMKFYLTGKFRKTHDGFEERTYLCIPSDKKLDDVLSAEQKREFNYCEPSGEHLYTEAEALTFPRVPVSELFKQIDSQGFATYIIATK